MIHDPTAQVKNSFIYAKRSNFKLKAATVGTQESRKLDHHLAECCSIARHYGAVLITRNNGSRSRTFRTHIWNAAIDFLSFNQKRNESTSSALTRLRSSTRKKEREKRRPFFFFFLFFFFSWEHFLKTIDLHPARMELLHEWNEISCSLNLSCFYLCYSFMIVARLKWNQSCHRCWKSSNYFCL